MAKMNRMDRRGSGPWFFIAIAFLFFCLYSLAIAWATVDNCDAYPGRTWQFFPPAWECSNTPGLG
jgi:hypothetical protein